MLNEKETIRISRFLSLVLRHQPQVLGLALDEQGWTDVATLLQKMNNKGFDLSMALLEHVVATNNKKRFAFNGDKTKIRANQGHSLRINLGYAPVKPPAVLYHGTGDKAVASILQSGLHRGKRHHVHLSTAVETATKVGQRHGKPVVFCVAALKMHEQGFVFYRAANEVWLTNHVPAAYLSVIAIE